jgi:hypothetical protein
MKNFQRCLLFVVALSLVGFAKRQPVVTVRFFTEANASGHDSETFSSPVMLHNPPRQTFIQKIPVISERNVVAMYPFPAADGSLGCAFRLDELGRIQLEALSVDHLGSSIVAFVNGRQIIDMTIDRRVTDGVISIPSGLTQIDIVRLSKEFKVLGKRKPR